MEDLRHDDSLLLEEEEPNETLSTIFDEDGSYYNSFSSLGTRSDLTCDKPVLYDQGNAEDELFEREPREHPQKYEEQFHLSESVDELKNKNENEAPVYSVTPKRPRVYHIDYSPSLECDTIIDEKDAPVCNETPTTSRIHSNDTDEDFLHLHYSPSIASENEIIIAQSNVECGRVGQLRGFEEDEAPLCSGTPKRSTTDVDQCEEDGTKGKETMSLNGTRRSSKNNSTANVGGSDISLCSTPLSSFETKNTGSKPLENDTSRDKNIYSHAGNIQKGNQYVKDLFNAHKNAGCPQQCLKPFSLQDIQHCREELRDMKPQEVKHFVMNVLRNQSSLKRRATKTYLHLDLMILGERTCSKCWCIVYGISDWRFRDSIARMKAGKTSSYRMKTRAAGYKREKTTTALAWMTTLFKRMGDYMPHREIIHLPYSWTKRYLYERMVSELHQVDLPRKSNVISYEHFTRIWKTNLPQYVISKNSDFTKCSVCTQLSDQYEKTKSHEGRATIARLKAEHDGQVERERKAYHDARLTARQDPTEMTCIIVDGMDQSKTSIPHFVVEDKDNANLAKLPVHFTGVLVHTASPEGKIAFIYHDLKHIPHDSNLTIHCITETLCEVKDHLGKALFLQMDNCGRENKNKYVLSFISLLVQLGIFKEAFVHFLPVGHTHEDIDQMFSCIARQLRCHNAFTMTDLEKQSSQSYSPHIKMVPVTMVQDVKEELLKHMAGGFTNHSKPLWFRFRQTEGSTYMHYRLHVNDPWKPAAESEWHMGLQCLKSYPDLSASLRWVSTSLAKTDFDKLCQEVPHAYNARLSADARQWWIDFLSSKIRPTYEDTPPTQSWNLSQLLQNGRTHYAEEGHDVENVQHLQSHILQDCPEISIGPQGKEQRGVTRVEDFSSLKIGMLAAVHCEQTHGRPHIAMITEITTEGVTVSWMKGSWTGSWHPWFLKEKGKSKPYSTIVPQNSIILWDFSFTKANRLRQDTVRELKTKYTELDSEGTSSDLS